MNPRSLYRELAIWGAAGALIGLAIIAAAILST